MLIHFLNEVDIQLILQFKKGFGKYHPVFLKILKGRFFGTPCMSAIILEANKHKLCIKNNIILLQIFKCIKKI